MAREAAHVRPHFGHEHFRRPRTHPRHRLEPGQAIFKRAQPLLDLPAHPRDGLIQVANVLQVLSDEQPVVRLHLASQRPLQFRPLLPQPTPG